jgi:hypothetical protein
VFVGRARVVAFVAVMAALANVLSLQPFAIPFQIGGFMSAFHFFQLAVFCVASWLVRLLVWFVGLLVACI